MTKLVEFSLAGSQVVERILYTERGAEEEAAFVASVAVNPRSDLLSVQLNAAGELVLHALGDPDVPKNAQRHFAVMRVGDTLPDLIRIAGRNQRVSAGAFRHALNVPGRKTLHVIELALY